MLNIIGAGQTVAGFAIVPIVADGTIDVYTLGRADLIVDVVGWFSNASAPSSTAGQFVAFTPERIFDTRFASPVNCCGITTPNRPTTPTTTGSRAVGAQAPW